MESVSTSPSPSPSRIVAARRRARVVKMASAGVAALGFGLLAGVVRGAHAGGSGTATPSSGGLGVSPRISQEAAQAQSFFDSGSVAPSTSSAAPQASTHTS
jgi:hypothetical protein